MEKETNKDRITCKTGLKPGIINKEVFEREIALCQKLHKENGGICGWGKCEECGVVPLLYKLHKGQLIEDPDELSNLRKEIFNL